MPLRHQAAKVQKIKILMHPRALVTLWRSFFCPIDP